MRIGARSVGWVLPIALTVGGCPQAAQQAQELEAARLSVNDELRYYCPGLSDAAIDRLIWTAEAGRLNGALTLPTSVLFDLAILESYNTCRETVVIDDVAICVVCLTTVLHQVYQEPY